ncbi:MAG: NAD(P)H-binding protein [Sediminibacterium sp.]
MQAKTALLLGASGLTGQHLLDLLLNDPLYAQITIYVRKPVHISHPKLVQQIIDFEQLDSSVDATDVFCCLGTTIKKAGSQDAFKQVDLIYPQKIAALQLAAGSQKFLVISAVGADANSSIFYSRTKGQLEASLTALGYPCVCIFRPSFIMGDRAERRVGEKIGVFIAQLISPLLIGPLKKYKPVSALALAKSMQDSAHHSLNGTHIISSDKIKSFE